MSTPESDSTTAGISAMILATSPESFEAPVPFATGGNECDPIRLGKGLGDCLGDFRKRGKQDLKHRCLVVFLEGVGPFPHRLRFQPRRNEKGWHSIKFVSHCLRRSVVG